MSNRFHILMGEKRIQIQSIYSYVREYCKAYEINLDDKSDAEFNVMIKQRDIEYEREKSKSEDIKEGIPIRRFSDEYLETLAVYRKIAEQMIAYDTILFHGSVIAVDGEGYLFTAKSGTGKSTHTRLWRALFGDRAVMVNDDKPLLKIAEDGVTVFGTPWDGKHRLSNNIAVPLKAICVLNRGETNHIETISFRMIYPMLLQQTYRSQNPEKLAHTLTLLERLAKQTKLYALYCNMEPEAAITAYQGMQESEVKYSI